VGVGLGLKTTQSVQRWTPYILWEGGRWGLTMSSHNDHLSLLSPSPLPAAQPEFAVTPPFSHALGMALSDPGNHESAFATRTPCRSSRGRWPAATKTRARRPLMALVAFAMTLAMTFLPGTAQVAQAQPTDPAATAQASTGNETPTATPCCHRSFLALAQHIAEQHPHYTEERDS